MFPILKQPYPRNEQVSAKLITALLVGLFIAAFLYFFRPFGLYNIPPTDAFLQISGYGLITTICLLINLFLVPLILPVLFVEEKWTVLHELLFTGWIILTIGFGNAVYTSYVFGTRFSLLTILKFEMITLVVAVMPVTFIILMKQNQLLRRNTASAERLSGRIHRYKKMEVVENHLAKLSGENAEDEIIVPAGDILFLNAADNYIEVHYSDSGLVKKKLLRNTLKNARLQLKDFSSFYRCHRSWIVNLDHVKQVKGNAQGYRLILDVSDAEIPVSRSLNSELDARLAK